MPPVPSSAWVCRSEPEGLIVAGGEREGKVPGRPGVAARLGEWFCYYCERYLIGSQMLTMPEVSRVTPHTQKEMPAGTLGQGKFGVVAEPLESMVFLKKSMRARPPRVKLSKESGMIFPPTGKPEVPLPLHPTTNRLPAWLSARVSSNWMLVLVVS